MPHSFALNLMAEGLVIKSTAESNYPTGLVSPRVSLTNVASLALFQENALFQSSSGEEYKKTPREVLDITLNSQ